MKKIQFRECLAGRKRLFLDGAMGTMLQAAGLPAGTPPEEFCLSQPDILKNIHLAYLASGSNIITSCTFGANPFKLSKKLDVRSFNRRMVEIAREAIAESGREDALFVAGNVGPSGLFAQPLGTLAPQELIAGFREQIEGLVAGGADLLFMETQFDLAEARACVVAAHELCDLPIMVSMTFEQGTSLTGSTPEIFAETMQNLGCAVIGTNCSLGPVEMAPVVRSLLRYCQTPVLAEPNAGLPVLENGKTIFPMDPGTFASRTSEFAREGVQILGGCCGTTPAHIAALISACKEIDNPQHSFPPRTGVVLTTRSSVVRIGPGQPLTLIGERINPTGKPRLAEELKKGEFSETLRLADAQIAAGANVLDVNVGAPLVDEAAILPQLVSLLVGRHLAPLSLDSSDPGAIAAALPFNPGSCLVNSISGEQGKMDALAPLCRNYGSPCVLLPIAGKNLPETAGARIAILETMLAEAQRHGIGPTMIVVDILALAVSSTPDAAKECLKFARYCSERNLATTMGLSNISFGLPARPLLNSAFLCMARPEGLASCIANPSAPRIMEARDALALLEGYDRDGQNFISARSQWSGSNATASVAKKEIHATESLFDAVLHGDRENILPILERELASGADPFKLVNDVLIPAITEVGAKYERKEYFLPQLIRSAETMQKAFGKLKPHLEKSGEKSSRPVIVMATVEGDIHDIGKNIVSLLLGNHGFEVLDVGKDVPAERIVACARENNASLIGLSALMTTTMPRMEDTIKMLKEENLPIKVLVGGAAVTKDFAESIGADAYCEDAVSAVSAAQKLVAETTFRECKK